MVEMMVPGSTNAVVECRPLEALSNGLLVTAFLDDAEVAEVEADMRFIDIADDSLTATCFGRLIEARVGAKRRERRMTCFEIEDIIVRGSGLQIGG